MPRAMTPEQGDDLYEMEKDRAQERRDHRLASFEQGMRVVVTAPTERNRHHAGRHGRVLRINPPAGRSAWVRLDVAPKRRGGAEIDAILAPSECVAEVQNG
jgi:hypothetical protein